MNKLISASLIFLGLIGVSGYSFSGDAAKGADLAGSCAACHGSDGNSPTPMFPKLAGLGEKYLLKQLKDIKSGERAIPEMTGLLDALSDSELADIAAFFDSKTTQLSGAKEMKVQVNTGVEVDALKLGAKIYRAGNAESGVAPCSGCHSPRGLGNAPAGFPRLSGQHADYIEKQLKAFRAGDRTNDAALVMRSVAKQLSDAEIKAVANFIAGLH